MPDPRSLQAVADLLERPLRIAVLGAHPERHRAAYYVPAYMKSHGWAVLPVNPTRLGEVWFDEPFRATLAEVGPVDLVNVFRPSAALAGHLSDLQASNAPVVWFQQGIRDDAVAETLRRQGVRVVQDRCLLADHRAWVTRRG